MKNSNKKLNNKIMKSNITTMDKHFRIVLGNIKRGLLGAILMFFANGTINAQCQSASDITGYTFSTGVGSSRDWLSPRANLIINGYNQASSMTRLGFTFTFEGTAYTDFSVNTDGNLCLGIQADRGGYLLPFDGRNVLNNNPKIVGIGTDLYGDTLSYGVMGTTPNCIGVFTYRGYFYPGSNPMDYFCFKVYLYEATGEIRIIYDKLPGNPPEKFQIGIEGRNMSKVVTVDPKANTVTTGATSNAYGFWPGQYRYYNFKPSASCPAVYDVRYDNITQTLFWRECGTATQWIVEYGPRGFTPGRGTSVMVNGTSNFPIPNLSSGFYDFYIRPYCSVGDTGSAQQITVPFKINYCGGDGTQANPYLICTETDLRTLSSVVNSGMPYSNTYFRLQNDIQMMQGAFTPIGNSATTFNGHFDGNNKSITNLTMTSTTGTYNGLFGMLVGGSISNLTVGGTIAGGENTGGIVGYAKNSVIRKCVNNAIINGAYKNHGGIAGSIANTKVLDCRNTANITGTNSTGGIVGYAETRSAIRRCSNSGSIVNGSGTDNINRGGIAGYFTNTARNGDTVGIFACQNSGSVNGNSVAAGIVGYVQYSNVDSCSNTANLSFTVSQSSKFGGVVSNASYAYIRRCSNHGNISFSAGSYLGGVCCTMTGGNLQYCINTGHIRVTYGKSQYVGGIVSYVSNNANIDYNTNSGDVICKNWNIQGYQPTYVGGIVAYNSGSNIRYNLNGGYIKCEGSHVGGICGYSTNDKVTYNLNVNNVKGVGFTGAILGYRATTTSNATNYWDIQMCPTTYVDGRTNDASCGKKTADLVGLATYPNSTYFTAAPGLYPIPKGMADSLGSKLAATPISLVNNEDVNGVVSNFTVGTTNGVSWTSGNTGIISINGANASVNGYGITRLAGTVNRMEKHIWLVSHPQFCGGSGTKADPYLICTANTLDSLAMYVNQGIDFEGKYFKMIRDLDLSIFSNWRIIGDSLSNPFKGYFDGNNKTIENFKITGTGLYRGLFGAVVGAGREKRAEIHNLTVKGTMEGGNYSGGIVGFGEFVHLRKLTNYVNFTNSTSYRGGIVGGCNQHCRIDSCQNYGRNIGASYVGGIVSEMNEYDTIEYCVNYGDVITYQSTCVGGIVGAQRTYSIIEGCENKGRIAGQGRCGGIVGYTNATQYVANCKNSGDIKCTGSMVGGIVGEFNNGSSANRDIYCVRNCINTGAVSGSYGVGGIAGEVNMSKAHLCENRGEVKGTSYQVGGIVGYNLKSIVSGCNNYGDVSSSYTGSASTSTSSGVGGIVGCNNYGSASNLVTIDTCNNYGKVKSNGYCTGGVVGMNYQYGHVSKSFNHGDVSGKYYVGGVAGIMYHATNTTALNNGNIFNCGNSGNIEGTYYVGGVIGRNGQTSGYYYSTEGSVNTGRVKGTNYVGGIAGYNYGYNSVTYRAKVVGCLNAGIVEATTNYAGGICGYTHTSNYAIQEYNLNVGNVVTPGTNRGGVDGYQNAPTSCYFDTLMCPVQYYYYGAAATTTTGKRTSALTDGRFNPNATYFTSTAGLYPRPTAIANEPITILAATPVFLDETTSPTNHVEDVNTCYKVGIDSNVSWTSSDVTKTYIVGNYGVVRALGTPTITAQKGNDTKDVDLSIVSSSNFGTFNYPAIVDTIGKLISGIRPSLPSGCVFISTDLPEGLAVDPYTGEISGVVLDTFHTTFTVISACSGCDVKYANVKLDIYPASASICSGSAIVLPVGETWYYDTSLTMPVPGGMAVVDSNTTFYTHNIIDSIVVDFSYTGAEQTYTIPAGIDSVKFQVWGAEGGAYNSFFSEPGKGGYAEGSLTNVAGQTIKVYVGGQGSVGNSATTFVGGGYNGGGSAAYKGGGGGGATDMRIGGNTLYSRFIVAGGGGGANNYQPIYSAEGGAGGGAIGADGGLDLMPSGSSVSNVGYQGLGATQTAGGAGGVGNATAYNGNAGTFGIGGNTGRSYSIDYSYSSGAGGGGWYGGGGAANYNSYNRMYLHAGGGGGSGYVYTAATASNYPAGCLLNSNYYLTNARTIGGNSSFPSVDRNTEIGHEGNGHARITSYYTKIKNRCYIVNATKKPYSDTIRQTLYAGASYVRNDSVYTLPGTYYQYFLSKELCDSIEVIEITVKDTLRDTIHPVICAGITFDTNGHMGCASVSGRDYAPYYLQGWYTQYLRDTNTGCFRNLVIDLTVRDTARDTVRKTICPNSSYTLNNVTYQNPGTFFQHLYTASGCDSTLVVIIYHADTLRDTIYPIICAGDTFIHNTIKYYSTGLYKQYWRSTLGCDSLIFISLTVRDTIFGHVYDTICEGSSVTYNGQTFNAPGDYKQILTATVNCDSFLTVHIFMNDTIVTHIYDTLCVNGTYNFLGTACTQTGDYSHLLYRTTGCDSTVILHLFVRDSIQSTFYDTICYNTVYTYDGRHLTQSGRYPKRLTSYTGCDSIVWLQLKVLDYPDLSIRDSGAYCEGGRATLKAITTGNYITWTSSPYDPSLNGQEHNMTIYVAPDRYTEYTATADIRPFNCLSSEMYPVNKPAIIEARMSMDPGEITQENLQCSFTDVSIGNITSRFWVFHENVPSVPDKLFRNEQKVYYTSSLENDTLEVRLVVGNNEGCYDTAINKYPIFRGDVWVPNAFTPGRTGDNRLLKVGYFNLLEYEIYIYTREGLLVFHSTDPEISWNGTYKYMDCKAGAYVYILHYRTKSRPSESYEKKGSVMLIR